MEPLELLDTIRKIEKLGGQYDPDFSLSANGQLLVCETLDKATPIKDNHYQKREDNDINENSSVNGGVDDSCKLVVDFELTSRKRLIITQLEACGYRTAPRTVAALLEEFFQEWPSYPWYWLSVVQRWPPRSIYRVIEKIAKQHAAGWITVRDPARLFSFLIKKRVQRKRRL